MLSKLHSNLRQYCHPLHDVLVQHRRTFNAIKRHNRTSLEVVPACGYQTFQFLHQSVEHSESVDWPWTNFTQFLTPKLFIFIYFSQVYIGERCTYLPYAYLFLFFYTSFFYFYIYCCYLLFIIFLIISIPECEQL